MGFGRIGYRFAEMLRPFGVEVLVNDVINPEARAGEVGAQSVPFDQLLAKSDIISVHVNMEANSRPVIGAAAFGIKTVLPRLSQHWSILQIRLTLFSAKQPSTLFRLKNLC